MTWARPWIRPALLSALGSLLICLSVPPVGWWWLAAIAWAPLTLIAAEAAGDRQAQPAVVGGQDQGQHREAHHRLGIGAQQKSQGDVAEGDAGQGGEQGRSR